MQGINKNLIEAMTKAGFQPEIAEVRKDYYDYTGYPAPAKKYALDYRSENYSIEEIYFWMLGHGMNNWGMPYVHKITDIFASSQGSTMFGDLGQRLTAMQNQASNLLATFGQMSKDLFKHVRDLRKLRERLSYYQKADDKLDLSERKKKSSLGAENTLKDIWITLIEGGTESPGSVYGLAKKLGFVILPDLFFQAPPMKEDEIKQYVDSIELANPSVKLALERKLFQFYHWKKETNQELMFKEKYQKKLIYQHYQSMKMYLNWVKPYLKNANQLQNNSTLMDSHGIISSFQSAMTEIEVLLEKPIKKAVFKSPDKSFSDDSETISSVVILHLLYETQPEMSYHAKDSWQQKAPSHVGRVNSTIRAYGWTKKEIEKYKALKIEEEIGIINSINFTLKDDQELLGDDLKQILMEVEEEMKGKISEVKKEEKKTITQAISEKKAQINAAKKEMNGPFDSVFGSFKSVLIDPIVNKSKFRSYKEYHEEIASHKKSAEKGAQVIAWNLYKNYKKAHKMITW